MLISANNIDVAGAEATSDASSSSQSAGASIGVSVGVGMSGAVGITPTASVSAGQSKSASSSTTEVMSGVSASNNITFKSKGDTTLDNTVFSADTIDGTVGGNLDIISTPGTGSQSNSSASLGFSFTGPMIGRSGTDPLLTAANADKALGGLSLGGIQPGFGSGKGSTSWIDTPAGLYSSGQQTINVGGNTNLAASGLISDTGQVDLTTGTFTWSDFNGSQEYRDIEVDANIDLYNGKDANGKNNNSSSAQGKYQLDDVQQTVKATVTGDITITDPTKQAALEQSGATKPADQVNKDPSQQSVITKNEHVDLEPYVSVQSLQAVADGIKDAIAPGGFIDKYLLGKQLTSDEVSDVKDGLDALGHGGVMLGCSQQQGFNLLNLLFTPAYAESECTIERADGTLIDINTKSYENCKDAIIAYLNSLSANERSLVLWSAGFGSTFHSSPELPSTIQTWSLIDAAKQLDGTTGTDNNGVNESLFLSGSQTAIQLRDQMSAAQWDIWNDHSTTLSEKLDQLQGTGLDVRAILAGSAIMATIGAVPGVQSNNYAGFNTAEASIIDQAKIILSSPALSKIRSAFTTGESITVEIGGRTIQYEPNLPASGMTMSDPTAGQ